VLAFINNKNNNRLRRTKYMKNYNIDFLLESIETENDTFRFKAKSITKDFVCEKGLDRLAQDSPNKPLIWRHEHPLIPDFAKTQHIYGRVLESKAENGEIISEYELYNHTKEHEKVRKVVEERFKAKQPIKISMRFRQYERDGVPIHFDVIEHSLTPTPACAECKMIDILNESDIMPDEKDLKVLEEIKKLEAELTKKDKALENLQVKLVTLEKDIESKDKELESKEGEKKEILDQLLEFKDKLNEQTKFINELKEARKMDALSPLIVKLEKLDGEKMKSIYEKEAISLVKEDKFKEAKKFLLERIEDLEKRELIKPETKDLSFSADESVEKELEDEKVKTKRDREAFAFMPEEFKKKHFGDK